MIPSSFKIGQETPLRSDGIDKSLGCVRMQNGMKHLEKLVLGQLYESLASSYHLQSEALFTYCSEIYPTKLVDEFNRLEKQGSEVVQGEFGLRDQSFYINRFNVFENGEYGKIEKTVGHLHNKATTISSNSGYSVLVSNQCMLKKHDGAFCTSTLELGGM